MKIKDLVPRNLLNLLRLGECAALRRVRHQREAGLSVPLQGAGQ